jgi:hypothetical protein
VEATDGNGWTCRNDWEVEVHKARRHLVINMDVNKTIIMSDKVSSKSSEHVVNEALSNVSWGRERDGQWTLVTKEPTSLRPVSDDGTLTSYTEWTEKHHPGSSNKKVRAALTGSFTKDGQPGNALQLHTMKALAQLKMPCGKDVGIVPSFFEMLIALKRNHRSFTLCFRTFGEDLADVAAEMNQFCEGLHPLFPGVVFDGSDGEPDYRFSITDPNKAGTFHRTEECTSLVMGTTEQPGEGKHKSATDHSLSFYSDFEGVQVVEGLPAVEKFLTSRYFDRGTFGFRDYFKYWKSKNMSSDGGKPFFFDAQRSTNRHEIFFDDNIHYSHFYIVQPVSLRDRNRKHWVTPLLRTHLVRAEPWDSIYDRKYFINHLARLEENYELKIRAQERIRALILNTAKSVVVIQRLRSQEKGIEPNLGQYDPWKSLRMSNNMISLPTLSDEIDQCNY